MISLDRFLRFSLGGILGLLVACGGGGGGGGSDTGTSGGTGNPASNIDLSIGPVNAPASANAGESVTVTVTVTNTGSEVVGYFGTSIYLSTDSTINSEDESQASDYNYTVNSGESITVTKTFTLPANLRGGTYYIGAIADSSGALLESNESNNVSAAAIDVAGGTCDVDAYEENDSSTAAGELLLNTPQRHNHCEDPVDWFTFQATAGATYSLTTSSLEAMADTSIRLYDTDASTILVYSLSSLEENASRLSWTAPASGTYFARVKAAGGLSDTGPNTGYTVLLGEATADLGIIDEMVNGSTDIVAGGTQWIWFSVYNNGFNPSGSFNVKAYLSSDQTIDAQDPVVGTYAVSDLAAGQSTGFFNVDVAIPKSTTTGTYYLALVADADNAVAEFNEGNNQSSLIQVNVTAAVCTHDSYEDDDFREYASAAMFGVTQEHNFCDDGKDWLSFDVVEGESYVVDASVITAWGVNIGVYDQDGNTLGSDTGNASGNATASVTVTAPTTGTLYAVATPDGGIGADNSYQITVFQDFPDLVVDWINTQDWTVYTGGVMNVSYGIRNAGFEDAGASEVTIYLSSDTTIDTSDIAIGTASVPAVAASAPTTQLTTLLPIPNTLAPGTYYLGAIADSSNLVTETYEDNNATPDTDVRAITVSNPPTCTYTDGYEQDDFIGDAKLIAPGATQDRHFCDDKYDWMKLNAIQGNSYVFDTNLGANVKFDVYDTDMTTRLVDDENDFLHWVAPADGTYYILASSLSMGTGTEYTLDVYQCDKDAYEDDDLSSTPSAIALGETQTRNFCDDAVDYVAFDAVAATTYTITATPTGGGTVSVDRLIAPDGTSILSSKGGWTIPESGTYRMEVTPTVSYQIGQDTEYTLTVQ